MSFQIPRLRIKIGIVLCIAMLLSVGVYIQQAEASTKSTDPEIKVFLDLQQMEFDVSPILKNGTTLVPFRALFETLGMEVDWEPNQRLVTGKNEDIEISLVIGEKKAKVNGKTFPLLEASEIVNDSTVVPLRFVSEATGAYVQWDPDYMEVWIISSQFIEEYNVDLEKLEKDIEELLASRAKEKEEEEAKTEEDTDPTTQPTNKPIAPVDLDNLSGMYYGFRMDYGGYECGGTCWELYTFLPNEQVFIGLPENGGPETIDCNSETCLGYSISNGELKLSNGESLSIGKSENGFLQINNINLDAVQVVPTDAVFEYDYVNMGYTGLIGVTGAASSWKNFLSLYKDGTYELSGFSLGSIGANTGNSTHASSTDETNQGRYEIKGNTITFTSNDGTVVKSLFFVHNTTPEGVYDDVQIGSKNYYVDD